MQRFLIPVSLSVHTVRSSAVRHSDSRGMQRAAQMLDPNGFCARWHPVQLGPGVLQQNQQEREGRQGETA